MAIALGATGTAVYNTAAGTTCLVPYPAGISAGDCLVLFVARSASAITVPAGWTAFTGGQVTTTGGTTMLLAYKLAVGTESGNLSVTVASSTGHGRMFLFTGVDQVTPQDVTAGSVAANATTSVLPSLTTVTAGACLIGAGTDAGAVGGTYTISDGNYIEDDDSGAQVGASNGRNAALYHWISGAAGATGTKTLTHANARCVGIHGALRPARVLFDAATQGASNTFTHTCTGTDRYLTVEVQIVGSSVSVSGITYNGVAMSLIRRVVNTNAVELWGLVNPASGAHNVVVTLSGAATNARGAVSFTNVDQTTPVDSSVSATGTGSPGAGGSITTNDGGMIVDAIVSSAFTVSAPTVQNWNDAGGDGSARLPGTGSAQQTSYSTATGAWAIASAALNMVGAVGVAGTAYTDADTVTVDITPSTVEARESADAATVAIAITPSGADVYTPGAAQTVDSGTVRVTITPLMTSDYLFAERFLDTTTNGWGTVDEGSLSPSGWTQAQGPTGDVSSGSGLGTIASPGAQTYRLNAGVSLPTSFQAQGTFRTTLPAASNIQGFPCWFYQDNSNHFRGQILVSSAGTMSMQLQKVVAGAVTNIGQTGAGISVTTAGTYSANEVFNWKLKVNGSSYIFKVWDFGTDEPSDSPGNNLTTRFAVDTVTDATFSTGDFGFIVTGNAATVGFGPVIGNTYATATDYTDAATVGVVITPSSADVAAYVEAATVSLAITPSSTDVAAYVDATTVRVSVTPSAVDVKAAIDTATVTVALTPSSTDVAAFVDTGTVPVAITPSTVEARISTDAATVSMAITPSAVDVAVFVDPNTVPVVITPSAVDLQASGGVDAATVSVAMTPSTVEAAQFVEAATVPVTLTPSGSDTQQFVEAATVLVTLTPSTVEARISTDSATVPVLITPSGVDAIPNTDTGMAIVTLTPSAVEAAQFAETTTVPVTITPSTVEARISTDSANVLLALTASGVESAQFADAANVPITLSPTASETAQFAEAVSVRLTLTPQSADTAQFVESATIPITLTPSVIEAYGRTLTDSGTVSMKFTPSAVESVGGGDAGTVPLTISSISDDVAVYADTATATVKMTPSGTEFVERAFLDTATIPVTITPLTTFEDLDKSDTGTPYVGITPGLLSEFQGEGDIVTLRITALLGEIFVHDDSTVVLLSIVPDAQELVSLTTMSTVVIDIEPGLLEDFFVGVDDATILLSIIPGIILEVQQVADYLLVGVLSNKWTAILHDNTYAGTLFETRYVVTGFDNRWHYRYRGRGDE